MTVVMHILVTLGSKTYTVVVSKSKKGRNVH